MENMLRHDREKEKDKEKREKTVLCSLGSILSGLE